MDASNNLWCKCSKPSGKGVPSGVEGGGAFTMGSRLLVAAKNRIEPKEMTIATYNEDNGDEHKE